MQVPFAFLKFVFLVVGAAFLAAAAFVAIYNSGQLMQSCIDSDLANDPHVLGFVDKQGFARQFDSCAKTGAKTMEYLCGEQAVSYKLVECPKNESCKAGVCAISKKPPASELPMQGILCTDSDLANDPYVRGYAGISGVKVEPDSCDLTMTKTKEAACNQSGGIIYYFADCKTSEYCGNGICLPAVPTDKTRLVTVRVVDSAASTAVSNAEVKFIGDGNPAIASTQTNTRGITPELGLKQGKEYFVAIKKTGYNDFASNPFIIPAGAGTFALSYYVEPIAVLQADRQIIITVKDQSTNLPVFGVSVQIKKGNLPVAELPTDSGGMAPFTLNTNQPYVLALAKSGYNFSESNVTIPVGQGAFNYSVTIVPLDAMQPQTRQVIAFARDAATSLPVFGASVEIKNAQMAVLRLLTGADGKTWPSDLNTSQQYTFSLAKTGYANTSMDITIFPDTVPLVVSFSMDKEAACTDADNDTYFLAGSCGTQPDCADTNPAIHPNVVEICDRQDNNCSGEIDEGLQCFFSQCADGIDNDGDSLADLADSGCQNGEDVSEAGTGNGFFGMEILGVSKAGEKITVTTTGAAYVLGDAEMEMWRRIDPATNSVSPKKVALLSFGSGMGPLNVVFADSKSVKIHSAKAEFEFLPDSLLFVSANSPFSYTHQNLVFGAPWNKGFGADRMWTDGFGGSLHAKVSGAPTTATLADSTNFSLTAGDKIASMVFPPKQFDFESLYGAGKRPFVQFVHVDADVLEVTNNIQTYANDGFGVIAVFGDLYGSGPQPALLASGLMGYKFADEQLIKNLVNAAHANGFKIVSYLSTPYPVNLLGPYNNWWKYPFGHPKAGQTQPLDTTLQWMREFQRDFGFDGWYFDNAEAGDFLGDYGFIKQVRADIGDSGIIYHHDSVDVWGPHIGSPQLSGLRAVFVDAYANYTLAGETGEIAEIDGPNDPYLRYFSSGYGLSQAFGSHKILSSAKLALTDFDKMRAMGQNLFGAERGVFSGDATGRYRYQPWLTHFKPAFEAKKAQYLSGTFNTSPDWPLNTQASWYREPLNFSIASNAANSVTINWQTSEPATSEIAYTGNGVFPANPQITDSTLATSHSATVNGLAAGTTYEFRARSSNRQSVPQEIVWNKVVAYTT